MYVIIFILLILVINFIFNYWNYRGCIKHLERFNKWLFDKDFNEDLAQDKFKVTKLIKNAGLYDNVIPVTRPMGLGQIANANIRPIDQYPNNMSDVAGAIQRQLSTAKGVYKERMLFSINPLLWIEFIVYLPSKIIGYLGFENATVHKFLNILWWVFGAIIIPILIAVYSDEITQFIKR